MKNRIKEIRSSLNISQKDFADSIGVKQSAISMMERGTLSISDRVIKTICLAYSVDEHWLRTGEGDMFPPLDESEDDLIEAIGMICSDNVDPVRKVLARAAVQLMLEIPDDAIPAFRKFIAEAHKGIESSENKNAEE